MLDNQEINIGFYWVLLSILDKHFYQQKALTKRGSSINKHVLEKSRNQMKESLRLATKQMMKSGVEQKKLKWLDKMMVN